MSSRQKRKPKIGVFKFASCDGCQLTLLDAEDELLGIAGAIDIAYFPEASRCMAKGPYDIALVEGSITTVDDAKRIQDVRRVSKSLIVIGACATAGGIQALRNWQDTGALVRAVYATPQYISTLNSSTPISDHVSVDFELRGCPINKHQLLELISASLIGRRPNVARYSVCMECKRKANLCVLVAKGVPCLGPVTQAGCDALCPSYSRGCYGCYGPMEAPNPASLSSQFRILGQSNPEIARLYRGFNGWANAFRKAAEDADRP